jgi:hypothetical protein
MQRSEVSLTNWLLHSRHKSTVLIDQENGWAPNIIIIIMALQPSVGPWPLFQFLDPIHSRLGSLDGRSARRKAYTYTQKNTHNKRAQHGNPCLERDSNPRSQR